METNNNVVEMTREQQQQMIEFSVRMTSDMDYVKMTLENITQSVTKMSELIDNRVKVDDFKVLEGRVRDIEMAPYATKADIDKLGEEINSLKLKPAKSYDQIKTVIATAIITGLIAFILTSLGLK